MDILEDFDRSRGRNQLTNTFKNLVWLIIPFVVGLFVAVLVSKIPSGGGLPYIPVSPFVIITVTSSIVMLYRLLPSFRNSRGLSFLATALTIAYTAGIYMIGVETPTSVTYNATVMYYLTLIVYIIVVTPFLTSKIRISYKQSNANLHSIYFATSIMWLSPFLADVLELLKWYISGELERRLSYMVLGGSGTNDVLFFYGFWMLASMILFHMVSKQLFKTSK